MDDRGIMSPLSLGTRNPIFPETSKPAISCSVYTADFLPEIKRPGREVFHQRPHSAEVKNECNYEYTTTLLHASTGVQGQLYLSAE